MAPISNASRLADFGTGIGTQGAGITVDNTNKRLGVDQSSPNSTFQVGAGFSVTSAGIITATGINITGSSITGLGTQGLNVQAQSITVAGVSTFYGTSYFKDDVTVTACGLDVTSGIVSATGLDIGTAGVDIDGQTDLDELVVAGVATFSNTVDVNASVDATDVSAIGGNFTGILTATSFAGNGANLTGVGGEVDITSVLFL